MSPRTPVRYREFPPLRQAPGAEPLEGMEVLEELRSDVGALLWQACRDVALWGGAREAPCPALFAPCALERRAELLREVAVDEEIQAPMAVFASLLGGAGLVDVGRLVHACRRVARWAEDRGKLGTATEFFHAAAAAQPEDASLAVQIGRLSRLRAQYEKAELWFRDAIVRARQGRDWQSYTEAYAGLGNLYVQKGNFPQARRFHQKCLRTAVRHGLREMEGATYHNLLGIAVECGEREAANTYASQALRAYSLQSPCPSVPRLSLDLAYHWIVGGHFDAALSLLKATLPHVTYPGVRVNAVANLARASGAVDDVETFERAWSEAWIMVTDGSADDGAARALMDLSHGAASLSEWGRAERAASKALDIARRRNEWKVVLEAEAALEGIRQRIATQGPPAPVTTRAVHELVEKFAEALRCA